MNEWDTGFGNYFLQDDTSTSIFTRLCSKENYREFGALSQWIQGAQHRISIKELRFSGSPGHGFWYFTGSRAVKFRWICKIQWNSQKHTKCCEFQSISSKICPENSLKISLFLSNVFWMKLAPKISAKHHEIGGFFSESVSENPA